MGCSSGKDASDASGKQAIGDALMVPEDLKCCPTFPVGTKSLCSKYVTPAVWDKCSKLKDSAGYTFQNVIFSGCKNLDSGIGLYAGHADSYTVFAPLMD